MALPPVLFMSRR